MRMDRLVILSASFIRSIDSTFPTQVREACRDQFSSEACTPGEIGKKGYLARQFVVRKLGLKGVGLPVHRRQGFGLQVPWIAPG